MRVHEFKGLDEAINKVIKIDKFKDFANSGKVLIGVAEDDFQKRFASSPQVRTTASVYGGTVWKRLSEPYLRSSPHREGGRQLIDTGELRTSLKEGQPGNVATISPSFVRFGSDLLKAMYVHRLRMIVLEHQGLADETELALVAAIEEI